MPRARRAWSVVAWLAATATGTALGACVEAPPPAGLDAGRRPRADGGPQPDGFVPRPSDPTLPPVDVELTLPFGESARVAIEVGAAVADLDLVLSVDTTGSFGGEIDALQSSFTGSIIPSLERRADRLAFAVVAFQDFPFGTFGSASDLPFELLTPLTTDLARVSGAIARLDMPLGSGGDVNESGYEALYQIATGSGLELGDRTLVPAWSAGRQASGGGTEPGVGFRRGSLRAVIHVTDAASHDAREYGEPAHDRGQTVAALREARLRVIGIASGAEARPQLEDLALSTGATLAPERDGTCRTGLRGAARAPVGEVCPLVFDLAADGTGLSDVVVQAIADLLRSLSYREMYGATPDDRLGLVRYVEAVSSTVEPPGIAPTRADLRPMDGVLDTFRDVERGVTVRFEALFVNDVIPPADYDQRITVTIDILGDGVVVATRSVRVTIPRGRLARTDAAVDASSLDASAHDAASEDAASQDAGTSDAATSDAGTDSAAPDAREPDDAALGSGEDAPSEDAPSEPDAP